MNIRQNKPIEIIEEQNIQNTMTTSLNISKVNIAYTKDVIALHM